MAASSGLYGSDLGANMARSAIAEAIGTFLLVFVGTSVACAAALSQKTAGPAYDSLAVALSFGLALLIVVAALGHVSGAHVNPAVTISLAVVRKFPVKYVPVYVGAQIVGAFFGSAATRITFGPEAAKTANLGAPGLSSGTSFATGFFVEALIAFILVFVIVSVATDERVDKAIAPLAVGFALACAVLVAGPVTGGSANPARALGPMIVSETFPDVFLFLLAPIVGGVIAAVVYRLALSGGIDPAEETAPGSGTTS